MGERYLVGRNSDLKKKVILVGNAVVNKNNLIFLNQNYDVIRTVPSKLKEALEKEGQVFVLWVHFDTTLDDSFQKLLRKVQYLFTTTTGLTHISYRNQELFQDRLISLNDQDDFLNKISSTAEHTWMLVMYSNNYLNKAIESVKHGDWDRQNNLRECQLKERTLGIVGYGRLGKMVAKFGKAFGMKVLIYDNDESKIKNAQYDDFEISYSIENLFEKCDVLSIHANATKTTKPIVTEGILSSITKPITLINTSRAVFVDEEAIIKEINSRPYLIYLTDVMDFEEKFTDIRDSKLWEYSLQSSRIVITPHIGGGNLEAIELCEKELIKNLLKL
jgi:D-3-phosphoglycerate dehydrogenase